MALPKQRHTKQRRDRARKELRLRATKTISCEKCSSPVVPHRACPKCGSYRGRDIAKKAATPKLKKTSSKKG